MNKVHMSVRIGEKEFRIVEGDLTEQDVDAIVNAANSHLQHGGGVAGAIVRKGGKVIQDESDRVGFTQVGHAAITTAGSLKADWVIHAVGPRWGEGDEDNKLESAVRSSLALAEQKGLDSMSFPAISAGIFGFPQDRCAEIITRTIASWLRDKPAGSLKQVDVCLLGGPILEHFTRALENKGAGVRG